MLVNTGEQIREMLVIGGGVVALAVILFLVSKRLRKQKDNQDEIDTDGDNL